MKKRFLSIVLAVLMLVSVLPVTAMAADGPTDTGAEGTQTAVGTVSTDGAIHVNKSVSADGKTLELEAFATNTVSTETTYDPLDIVLVLDVSGSMGDNNITSYKYTETTKKEWSCDDIYNSSVYYYYMDGEGYYRRVSWDDEGGIFRPYRCWITAGGTRIGNKVPNWNDVSYRGKLYTRTNEGTVTRMQALKTAVNKFIDNVATQKDSEGNVVKNHISIVKFAGKMQQTPNQYKVGNDTYKEYGNTYNYSQIVTDMTDVSTGSAALKAAVNGLKAGGATSADYGMQLASYVLSQHKDNPVRRSVVIMFTDGEPNHSSDFDKDVAKDAIAAAKGLKDKNTVVFTIGIFNGAYPNASVTSNNTSDTNKYMHAVSSNYPGAAYIKTEDFWSTSWDWSFGERAKDSNYYLAASNAADLEDIFVEISNEVNTLAVKVDATSVLSDTLSGAFDFNAPENAEYSGITVAKYPVTGMENGVYTWGAAQELAIGEGEGKVQVEVSGKKLEVTGFDYGANAVTTKTEGGSTAYSGYKLVVTIPIKPDTEYHGWADGANYYDTNSTANGSKAGLEYGETGSRQKLELNESPNAPVTGYTVSYEFKGTAPDGVTKPDDKVYIEGQNYTIETAPSKEGWTFKGWCSDEACTAIVSGQKPMGTEPVTYYGKWEQKQPGVSVEKTATYTRGDADPVTLRNNTNDLNKIGRVQVGDVINYTVTIENTGDITFGYNVSDYRAIDTFSNATGDLIQIDENGKEIRKVESGKVPPNISLGGMNPGDIKTLYYRYEVLSGDVGNQINNSATAEIKSGTGAGKIQKSSNVRVLVEAPKPKTATLSFEFKSGMEGKDLPAGMPTEPKDVTEEVGKEVQLTNYTETVNDEENIGKWTFVGWYTDADCTEAVADPYVMPNTDTTLYGKWTFEADKPEITEAGYTVEYYRQDADGNYSNKPYYTRTTTDAGVPLKGNVGDTVKIEELEPFYKEHYKGYEFDAENANNIPQCTLQADASKNVLKIYYKALPKLEVKKEVDKQYNVKHGDTLTYTITVKNAGARNLTNVKVTDVIDAADPSKLEILPGDGYTYHEESGKIEIGNMVPRAEVVIKATYVVQEADSGNTIKNTATGSADEVEGVQATVSAYPNKIEEFKGDLVISKTYRSDTSTSPAATFYFDVYYMDGDEQISLLDEYAEISFDKNEAKKGEPATKTVEVKLNDVNEKVLESGFYVREVLEDKVDKVVYDRNAVHGFLVPFPLISAYADTDREPITVDREAYVVSTQVYENAGAFWAAWVTDELDENYNVFSFTNTYKTVRNEPVKVGPQLNRDDHVAYIMGYPDGTVQPEGEITRAEACTIFFRLLTDSSRDYYFARTNDYSDVNRGDWFNNAISTLSNAGIVTGYNDGTFRPNQPITRGEMAKIIANFANLNKGTKSFTDLSGHWSKTYVELAAGNGWIAGYPDGSFRPDQKITRAETVTMINRVLERVPAKELRLLSRSIMLTFPDNNPGDWYYIAIQEASNSHEYQRSVYETAGDEMWTKLIDNVDWTKLEK